MNKELKFRAWDDGQMIYSDEWKESIEKERDDDYTPLGSFFHAIREDAIVMQFVGRKDQNDKEIYEGDIVQADFGYDDELVHDTRRAPVVFLNGKFVANSLSFDLDDPVEVVGNIYQNPGMLNKTEQK